MFYYVFGRFMGMAWYFFPALLLLILFVLGKKSLDRWLILAALAGEILIYVVMMPDNFGGGGGSLANRYFLCIYPFFLFLARPAGSSAARSRLAWAVAAVLIGPILVTPSSPPPIPSMHAKRFPFTLFPVEKTQHQQPADQHRSAGHAAAMGTPPRAVQGPLPLFPERQFQSQSIRRRTAGGRSATGRPTSSSGRSSRPRRSSSTS